MSWPFIALTVVALALVLYTERRAADNNSDRRLQIAGAIAKTLASIGFLGAAIVAGAFDSFFGQTLFIALVWSALGDVLLIAQNSRPAFLAGVGAFLMSHIGYVMVFRLRGIDTTAMLIAAIPLTLVGFVIWRWLRPHAKGAMRFAVPIYIAVITLMVACAVGTVAMSWALLPILAATLFWLSDITVARQRFVAKSFWNRAIGLPLYYAAQHLFVGLLL